MTDLIQQVAKYVSRVPIVVLRLSKDLSGSLWKSQKGLDWFSFTERHEHFNNMKSRRLTLCLLEARGEDKKAHCYLGVARNQSVSTVDSRLTLEEMVKIGENPMRGTVGALLKNQDKHIKNAWKGALQADKISVLTPELSVSLVELLAKNSENFEGVKKVFSYLMERCKSMPWTQRNAIKLALSAFGFQDEFVENQDIRLHEDKVIAHDAAKLPGFEAVAPDLTGRFVYTRTTPNGPERVVVYVANKNSLEEMAGVDLIYINHVVGNIVMVQYKMLDHEAGGWMFRPDTHFWEQLERMKIPVCLKEKKDYRLNSNPFFFKFVRRRLSKGVLQSFVLSLDHLKQHLESPEAKGKQGGRRLTYKSLGGAYLLHEEMVGLLRSGYVGTHRAETEVLTTMFDEAAKGDRDIVVAWKPKG